MSNPRIAALAACLLLVVVACGDDSPTAGSTTTTTTAASAPATTDGSATAPPTSAAPSTTAQPTTTTTEGSPQVDIDVVGGQPVGGAVDVELGVGDEFTIAVTADSTDHVHIHGYDLFADVTPDAPAVIEFTADIPGQFEVELEDTGVLLAEIEVR